MKTRENNLFALGVAFVVCAAVFLAFYGANSSMWLDEAYSVLLVQNAFPTIIEQLKNDTHPPLYYFLLKIWTSIFGISEFAARSLSGAFYLGSIAAVYFLGREIGERKVGLLAAFFYALSPLATGTAQSARMYALLGLLAAFSTWFFVRIFLKKDDSRLIFLLFVAVNILGTFTQIWFFFLLAAQILVWLILFNSEKRARTFSMFAGSVLPFAVLWTPILLIQMKSAATDWLARPGLAELTAVILGFYGERLAIAVYAVFAGLLVLSLAIERDKFAVFKDFWREKSTLVLFSIAAAAIFIPFLISQIKPVFGQTRYAIIALPAFVVLIAALLGRVANRFVLLGGCVLIFGVVGASFVRFKNLPAPCSDRNSTQNLLETAAADDVLIFTSLSKTTTEYYLRRAKADNEFVKFTFPQEIEKHPGWRNERKMLENRAALETEAAELLQNLNAEKSRRIYLFYGLDREVSGILKQKLDAQFVFEKEIDAACENSGGKPPELFYTQILIYRQR